MYLSTSVLHTNVRFELVCTFIPRKMSHSVSGSVLQLEEENTNQINRNRCTWFSKTRPKPSKKCSTIHLQKTGKRNPSPPSESPVFFKHQKIPGALSFKTPGVVVSAGQEFLLTIAFEFGGGQIWGNGFGFVNDGWNRCKIHQCACLVYCLLFWLLLFLDINRISIAF